ncbi:MAG TPA: bifunctional DNA primase/polymerase, partial [Rhizomicrobium sp.]
MNAAADHEAVALAAATPRTKLDHALALAARGFHIFPVRAKGDVYKSKSGKTKLSDGKVPAVDDWPNKSTRYEAQIRRWWKSHPNRNIGIDTGKPLPDGRFPFAVDVDVKGEKQGEASLRKLIAEVGAGPMSTWEQATPSGGMHLLFSTERPMKQGVD